MKTFFNILKQSLVSILNNKARSFLTMLGIAIAVFVVVAVDSISNGLAQNTSSRFSNLDAKRITISSQQVLEADEDAEEGGDGNNLRQAFGAGAQVPEGSESLTEEDLLATQAIENVALSSPLVTGQARVEFTDESQSRISISGVSTAYEELEEFTYGAGSFFGIVQQEAAENVVVIDDALAVGLYADASSAIDQSIILGDVDYTIVGVLTEPEEETQTGGRGGPGGFGGGQSSNVYVPYTSLMASSESEKIASIVVETESEEDVENAAEAILELLYASHDITEDTSDVSISTSADALDTISGITAAQSKSDKFIGWIVLVVGGIGIMNIMLVTVSERTKEIGLRKALGAKNRHIIMQFMTESISLTALGGVAGLLIAIALSGQVTEIFEIQSSGPGRGASEAVALVDTNTVVIALSASILSGLIFGIYPAIKASKKQPVEALRHE